jgi:hypothetical protein
MLRAAPAYHNRPIRLGEIYSGAEMNAAIATSLLLVRLKTAEAIDLGSLVMMNEFASDPTGRNATWGD